MHLFGSRSRAEVISTRCRSARSCHDGWPCSASARQSASARLQPSPSATIAARSTMSVGQGTARGFVPTPVTRDLTTVGLLLHLTRYSYFRGVTIVTAVTIGVLRRNRGCGYDGYAFSCVRYYLRSPPSYASYGGYACFFLFAPDNSQLFAKISPHCSPPRPKDLRADAQSECKSAASGHPLSRHSRTHRRRGAACPDQKAIAPRRSD